MQFAAGERKNSSFGLRDGGTAMRPGPAVYVAIAGALAAAAAGIVR